MKHVELTVRGENATAVPRALQEFAPDERFDYDGDGFAAIVAEQYFYRVLSSLQTTVLFEKLGDTTVDVTLVSGGGAAGLGKDDVDAEGQAVRDLVNEIETFCDRHNLDVVR